MADSNLLVFCIKQVSAVTDLCVECIQGYTNWLYGIYIATDHKETLNMNVYRISSISEFSIL